MGLSPLEVLHLFYALAGVCVLCACFYIICSRRKRRDRTVNSIILTVVTICIIYENIIIAFGSTIGLGDTLDRLSRARLIVHSLVAPGFIVVLTRLAARFRINWPWWPSVCRCSPAHAGNETEDDLQFRGRVWTGIAVGLSIALATFTIVRDSEEVLDPSEVAGTTSYAHEHNNWGVEWDDVQEWLPTAVLVIWSVPIAYLIHKKGGLKWYHNKLYLLPLVAEVLLVVSRCMPRDSAVHVSNGAELMLLITFIFLEDKLSGEIQEIRLLEKMIKIRQAETRISEKLGERYPAPDFNHITPTPRVSGLAEPEPPGRGSDPLAQSFGPESPRRGTINTSLHRQATSAINAQGFLAPSQLVGFGAEVHDANMKDNKGQPLYDDVQYGNRLALSSSDGSFRGSGPKRSAKDEVLRMTVLKSLHPTGDSEPRFTVKPNAGGSMHLPAPAGSMSRSSNLPPRKRPGHARKHSF